MEVDLGLLAISLYEGFLSFLEDSIVFAFIKFFLFVYVAVLLVDIVLLFVLRDVSGDLRTTLKGDSLKPLVRRNTAIKRWETIVRRLEKENESQWKASILEADAFADELLKGMGFKGANMKERLDQIQPSQIESKPQLETAHQLRNRIVNDLDFSLTKEQAEETLDQYKAFFREIELFS